LLKADQDNHSSGKTGWREWIVSILLILILLIGAAFRLTGVNWDDLQHLHPDERFLTMVTSALSFPGEDNAGRLPPGCRQWGGFFDTECSPLNPYNHDFGLFVYGTLPIFLTRWVGEVVNQTGYDQIHLVGRVLSALFDLSTVLLIFLIGRRLYGVGAGLLGALFLASSVLDIQQSHFFTVDTFTNVPILIAFWYALDVAGGKKWPAFLLAGIAFGLALAGRINIAPFAAVLIAAAALRAYRQAAASSGSAMAPSVEPNGNDLGERAPIVERHAFEDGPEVLTMHTPSPVVTGAPTTIERSVGPVSVSLAWRTKAAESVESYQGALMGAGTCAFIGLAAIAIIALVIFRIGQPYAANGPNFISPHIPRLDLSRGPVNFMFDVALSWAGGVNPKFADNMSYVSELVAGKIDAPPGHQWTDRTPYVFPFENMVLWGLGLPLGLAGWAGFVLALYQLVRYRRWQHLLIVVWVGLTFAYTGQQFVKTMRYFLQIYPFLALLGGWFIVELWNKAKASGQWSVIGGRSGARTLGTLLKLGVVALALIIVGYTLFWAGAFTTIYTRPVSRVAASRWIFANVPRGAVIGNEHWDDPLPLRIEGQDPYGGTYRSLPSSSDGEMHWYDEDTPEKRTQAIQWLDNAEYVVLSSNRLYGSIPRLPMRYPMTTKYYQWLFDGTLGFQRVATFTSRPQLFGIEINDDNAEEAFTVYDHAKVLIFRKTPQYSHTNTEALFNSVNLDEVYRFFPPLATQAKTALLLTPTDSEVQQQGGTWTEIFDPGDWVNQIPVLGWLVMIEILGLLAFPITFVVCRGLADRGYIFAKALGILFPAWGAWILASLHLVGFSRFSIVFVILCIALMSAVAVRLQWRELFTFLREQKRVILVEEILFLAFFGLDLFIRYGNPDLWHQWFGGEKPMDFAYLNAIVKSTWFPPYDPWFAGGYIDYYYFGQLITATLIRLSGIVPEVAYNLALPMYFALLAMGAFSVVFNLVVRDPHTPVIPIPNSRGVFLKPVTVQADSIGREAGIGSALLFGLLGAFLIAVIGNLGELVLIGQTFAKIGDIENRTNVLQKLTGVATGIVRVVVEHQPFDIPTNWWYWNASRVIPGTINEFPFFTFLYADLHAHLMALPFTLVALGLAVNFATRGREQSDDARLPFWPNSAIAPIDIIEVIVASLVLGSLRAINLADSLTYPLIIACALGIGEYARRGRVDLAGIGSFTWRLLAILVLSSILYQPFNSHFVTASASIELWKDKQTALREYVTVHGIFLFVIATFLIWQTFQTGTARRAWQVARNTVSRSGRLAHVFELQRALAPAPWFNDFVIVALIAAFFIEVGLILVGSFVFALAFPLLVIAGLLVLKPDLDPGRRLVLLFIAAGLALTLAVELVRYKDDIGRMNTVFKFYLQVWVLFAISAAAGLAFVLREPRRAGARTITRLSARHRSLPTLWWAAFALLIFAGTLYPVFATLAKVNDRMVPDSPSGLNGMDYMQKATYEDANQLMQLGYDYEAIQWLRLNVQGSPVILEANGPLYHWTSRVSINTGLPTVIGWDWHQKQQRSIIDGAIIDRRIQDVKTLYNTVNVSDAVKMLARFHVSYIYVGPMEHAFYEEQGLAKFDRMAQAGLLELVHDNGQVKIYRVKI
jgi:YYY domain-containing protein